MAIGISAAYNSDTDSPGVNLSITGLTGFENISVVRIDNTGYYDNSLVRGLDAANLDGASTIVTTDFEAPIGKSIQYQVTGYDLNPGLAFRGTGTVSSGTTSCTPTFVAGVLSTDISFLYVVVKPYTATVATPAGWTLVTNKTSGTTGSGEDTGSVNLYVFKLEGTGSTPTVTGSGSNVILGKISTWSKDSASLTWDVSAVSGADNTNGTSYSATGTSMMANAKSSLLGFTGVGAVATVSNASLSLPNAVVSTTDELTEDTTSTGHNVSLYAHEADVLSVSGSGSPVLSATLTASATGSTIFVAVTVSEQASETVSSSSLTIPYASVDDAWIKSVFTPLLSRKVDINEFPGFDIPTKILGNYKVLGRSRPVILTDTFGGSTGTIKIISGEDFQPLKDIKELIVSGGVLMFQTTSWNVATYPDFYFQIESYSIQIKEKQGLDGLEPMFIHEISFIEVDRPSTTEESLGLRSYQTVMDAFSTYQDFKDAYATYYDALIG